MEQYYKIAGLTVKMDTFGRTETQAIPFRTIKQNNVDIHVTSEFQQVKAQYPELSDDGCEVLGTGRNFYLKLLDFNGMMLHSCALVLDGKAYLFSAESGTGKSTHVCVWRQVFGDDKVRVLNDDKPALRLEDGVWYAYGTPWSGKSGQNLNLRVPLAGIAMLERGEKNEITPFSGRDAVSAVFRQCSKTKDPIQRMKILELLDKLMTQVPIWKLRCNMDPEAAIVAYEAMSGQKYIPEI